MPVLIRWYLKTALIYLVAALGVGIVLGGQSVFNLPGFVRSQNAQLLLTGRVLQAISAAAFALHAWPRVIAAGA